MKIGLTGGIGGVGSAITTQALARGDTVVSIDRVAPPAVAPGVTQVTADIADYHAMVEALAGCDAVIHMAAIPTPLHDPDDVVHNNNVVGSYNVMRAAIECGARRICQASSVNALGLSFGRAGHFDYFPLDEHHPTYAEDAYALSKWICEQQADSLVRHYDDLQISSMRFHWVIDDREMAVRRFHKPEWDPQFHLWAYTLRQSAAEACLLSLEDRFIGHEAFYIVAPDTISETPSRELAARYFPDVPIRGDFADHRSFFDSSKAERMLGWRHPAPLTRR
jgi:nucleoside-diphosphate-sugar epimerase